MVRPCFPKDMPMPNEASAPFELDACAELEISRPVVEVAEADLEALLVELGETVEGWDPAQGPEPIADLVTGGDVALLRKKLRRQLGEEVRRTAARLFACWAMDALLPRLDFEPEEARVEEELTRMVKLAAEQGHELSEHELETMMRPVVVRQLREQRLLATLAETTGIAPNGPELTAEMECYAARYELSREELLADAPLAMEVANELYQQLVLEAALAKATITDQPMTRVEALDELRRALLAKATLPER